MATDRNHACFHLPLAAAASTLCHPPHTVQSSRSLPRRTRSASESLYRQRLRAHHCSRVPPKNFSFGYGNLPTPPMQSYTVSATVYPNPLFRHYTTHTCSNVENIMESTRNSMIPSPYETSDSSGCGNFGYSSSPYLGYSFNPADDTWLENGSISYEPASYVHEHNERASPLLFTEYNIDPVSSYDTYDSNPWCATTTPRPHTAASLWLPHHSQSTHQLIQNGGDSQTQPQRCPNLTPNDGVQNTSWANYPSFAPKNSRAQSLPQSQVSRSSALSPILPSKTEHRCENCPKVFTGTSARQNLARHRSHRTCSIDSLKLKCDQCGKMLCRSDALKNHKRKTCKKARSR